MVPPQSGCLQKVPHRRAQSLSWVTLDPLSLITGINHHKGGGRFSSCIVLSFAMEPCTCPPTVIVRALLPTGVQRLIMVTLPFGTLERLPYSSSGEWELSHGEAFEISYCIFVSFLLRGLVWDHRSIDLPTLVVPVPVWITDPILLTWPALRACGIHLLSFLCPVVPFLPSRSFWDMKPGLSCPPFALLSIPIPRTPSPISLFQGSFWLQFFWITAVSIHCLYFRLEAFVSGSLWWGASCLFRSRGGEDFWQEESCCLVLSLDVLPSAQMLDCLDKSLT